MKPDQVLSTLKVTRNNIINLTKKLSIEQLNKIPDGFKNNIFWNLGHVLVTQQLLCYKNARLEMSLPNEFVDKFKKGTSPETIYHQEDLNYICDQLISIIDHTRKDYNNELFKDYNKYQTSYGLVLNNIEDAFAFNNLHEGVHLGYMMAMRKNLV